MEYRNDFVVDWPVAEPMLRSDAAVHVTANAREIGLYRVKKVGSGSMLLSHGGISLPVGTKLIIEDFQRLLPRPRGPLSARVVGNDGAGISVRW